MSLSVSGTHTQTSIHLPTHSLTYTDTQTQMSINLPTHSLTYTDTNTHTHTHTHHSVHLAVTTYILVVHYRISFTPHCAQNARLFWKLAGQEGRLHVFFSVKRHIIIAGFLNYTAPSISSVVQWKKMPLSPFFAFFYFNQNHTHTDTHTHTHTHTRTHS